MSFVRVYALAFVRPGRAMETLARAPARLRWGVVGVSIAAVTYTLVYFFLSRNGGRPTVFKPWLAVPAELYYRYNLLWVVPSILLGWVAAAGFAQLVAVAVGGRGRFEDLLAVFGVGIGVATWATGLHDVVTTAVAYLGFLDQRAYEDAMSTAGTGPHRLIWALMALYLGWMLALLVRGAAAAQGLRGLRAGVVGGVGFVVYQAIFALFNR